MSNQYQNIADLLMLILLILAGLFTVIGGFLSWRGQKNKNQMPIIVQHLKYFLEEKKK
jgi:drug/metabolite transporter superfamily protein YnfA